MSIHKLEIDSKHLEASEKLLSEPLDISKVKSKSFRSFDPKFLEKQVNEFLEDAIYVKHYCAKFVYDTSSASEFSDKVKLYNYVCAVYYME